MNLGLFQGRIHPQQFAVMLLFFKNKGVHTNYYLLPGFHIHLVPVGRFFYFFLLEPGLDGVDGPARLIHPADVIPCATFNITCQRFNGIGTCEGIHGARDPAFASYKLLRPESYAYRLFRGKGEGFVSGIGME